MSIFGWSLPPGCSCIPDCEDAYPCVFCGKLPNNCECPECEVCGEIGNPECVGTHMPPEKWPMQIRFCSICGMNDPASKHFQPRLAGSVPICRDCWEESENEEARREQEEAEEEAFK